MKRKAQRSVELRRILDERRRVVHHEVEHRLHSLRCDHPDNGRDDIDASDDATRRDLEQALLQLGSETLIRIDAALVRFAEGNYGVCAVCEGEIAAERLRALPFAVRCRTCEQAREDEPQSEGPLGPRPSSSGDFTDSLRS